MLYIILIAIGLAMDAFAVSISSGVSFKKPTPRVFLKFGLFFGIFQFIMPVIGYFGAYLFSSNLNKYSNIISFALLIIVGGKMLYEALICEDEYEERDTAKILCFSNMLMLAIATSIDALAIGVFFAFNQGNILLSSIIIGIVAFAFSVVGVILGSKIGNALGNKAEILGGVILIFLAFRFLLY